MPDKTGPKDLETLLARLTEEWQELAALLTSQGKSQDRVVEVEKILLRDASGQYRGEIYANPDGSADLLLSDRSGNAWVRLGVNRDGEAFLELKDQKGESSFKAAVGASCPGAGPGPSATPADGQKPDAFRPPGSPVASPQHIEATEAGGEPRDKSGLVPALPTPDQDEPPGRDANAAVLDRLEKLARQYRRLKWFGGLILGLLGVILAIQVSVLLRPHSPGSALEALVVRDLNGNIRASLGHTGDKVGLDLWDAQGRRRATLGLGAEGVPGLAFYDQDQRVRAELSLGPAGEPKFTLRDQHGMETPKEPKSPGDSAQPRPPAGTGLGPDVGPLPSPPAGPAKAVSPDDSAQPQPPAGTGLGPEAGPLPSPPAGPAKAVSPDDSAQPQPPGGTGLGPDAGTLPSPPAGPAKAVSPDDFTQQRPPAGTGLGAEAGALPSPSAGPAEAISPNRDAEAEIDLVGSKTSNKYHYPTCKWVRAISPWKVIKFKSAKEAQERNYIPCPVCKPPPLSE
jgi:hypothetical protein